MCLIAKAESFYPSSEIIVSRKTLGQCKTSIYVSTPPT